MNRLDARNDRLRGVTACPVAIPVTTMKTSPQGQSCAALSPNWDGTLPVSKDYFPIRAEALASRSGGSHE